MCTVVHCQPICQPISCQPKRITSCQEVLTLTFFRCIVCYGACQREITTQYYSNINPNHKKSAMCRMRTPNPDVKCKGNLYDKVFVVYVLGIGVLAGRADPKKLKLKVDKGFAKPVIP